MKKSRSVRLHAVKVGLALTLLIPAGLQRAQQKFDDPFTKTGFQAGDLYSSLGNSSIDAVTGRVIYSIPLNSVPRNGKLPQGLSLVYNSNHSRYTVKALVGYFGLLGIPQVNNYLVDNHTSTLAYGWRLSMGTIILGSNEANIFYPIGGLQNGLVFIDSSGVQHRLRHTNGCPPDTCPSNSAGYNEMQPGLFRSADGEFYWAKVTHTGTKITADSITQVEVRSPEGLIYIFDEFHPVGVANPALASFISKPIKIGEVKIIRDPDNNQLTLTYDLGGNENGWLLKRLDDGIRAITLDWNFTSYMNKTLNELRQLGYVNPCVESGQPDMRSCRTANPPPHCRSTSSATDSNQDPVDPPDIEPGSTTPPTFSGSFLNQVTIRHAGEQGEVKIYTQAQDLCRTVIDDHLISTPNIPAFATMIKKVELNQVIATIGESFPTAKSAYNFIYLPSGMMWKARNPLGSEEEFRWRSYEPLHWDEIDESCDVTGTTNSQSFAGPPVTPNTYFVCITEFHVNPPSSPDPGRVIPSTSCSWGGGPSAPGSGDDSGGFGGGGGGGGWGGENSGCNSGTQIKQLRCEHYDFANPLFDPKPGYSRPSSCGPIPAYIPAETGYTSAEKDPNCQCRNYVIEHAQLDSACNTLGGAMNGSSYGVHDRILRDGNGNSYQWRYNRIFDDHFTNLPAGTSRSDSFTSPVPTTGRTFQDRRFVEITNPDHTVERLYFYENSSYVCSLGAQANKQGQPSAREILDMHGDVIMREEYEYMGFPMPGSVKHQFQRGGGNLPLGHPTQYWDLGKLHADYFRVATTTKYYKPHFKPSLIADDTLKTGSIVFSNNDDFRAIHWNPLLTGVSDRSGFIDLPSGIAQPLVNGSYDDQYLLYARRSEQSNYLELGHFGKAKECDVQEVVDSYFDIVSRLTTHVYGYKCADEFVPPINEPGHTRASRLLPAIAMDKLSSRTWWNADKNPATNSDRAKWTIHQPVQQFMVDAGGKVFGASMSRYTNGKLEQMRGLDLPASTCTVNQSAFPHSNVYDYSSQPAVPTDALLDDCAGRTADRDQLDKRAFDGNGNLNRQEIALGAQTLFSGNGTGTLVNPFALNFTWLSGSPVSSQFDGFSYKNQERDVNASTGLVQRERDPNGKQTAFAYDNLMRVTTITPPDSEAVSTIAYPTMTDAVLSKGDTLMNYHYDGLGRVWKTDKKMPDGSLVFQYTGYDYAGRKSFVGEWTAVSDFNPRTLFFECDPALIPASVKRADGSAIPLASIIAPPGAKPFPGTYTCFDALGRPERVIAADGATTEYRYLGVDSLVRVFKAKNANGHPAASSEDQVTKYFHDAFGRLIMVDTDCQFNWSSPAAVAALDCGTTAGQGADAVYFYDIAGRLVFVNLIPQLPANPRAKYIAVQLTPDEAHLSASTSFGLGQIRKFSYDSLGRLKSATNPENGRVDYLDYDAFGNVLEVQDEKGRATAQIASFETNECGISPSISAVDLGSGMVTVACPANTPAGTICLDPATSSLSVTWTATTGGVTACSPQFTWSLTRPTTNSLTGSCFGTNTTCKNATFDLRQSGVVASGSYRLQLTLTNNTDITVQATRTYAINIPPSPPDISFLSPAVSVTAATASFSYVSSNAPTGSYVDATLAPAAILTTNPLPPSGAVALSGLYGHGQVYHLLLVLRDTNGVELDRSIDHSFTVNRDGTYTLRYTYDKRGRLTGVNKLDLATGVQTPLTKLFYDGYGEIKKNDTAGPYFADPGGAPLGKKTGAISYQPGGTTIAQAIEYLAMGGRPSASHLIVDDNANPRTFTAATSYNDLGLPATMTYPSFVGGALSSSSVYTAGYLQGLSGNATDNNLQRNYLTGLSYNPAGTLANFNLGNGAQTLMSYDNRNRPLTINNTLPGFTFNSGLYQYDGAGNITNIGPQSFTYDRLNRLTDAHVTRTLAGGGAPFGTQDFHYVYDPFGNMTKKYSTAGTLAPANDLTNPFISQLTFGRVAIGQPPRLYDAGTPIAPTGTTPLPEFFTTNRINDVGFLFDPNGNMIQDKSSCYAYDELNRMTSATLKTSGACAATPVANYYYDADNLRVVKQSRNTSGTVTKYVTSMRGGLDALADFTTHVADGQETSYPFEQKNYIYGPGGLIASEKRSLSILGRPRWQIYGQSTGCAVNDPAATATNQISNGYDLALDFGACASATVTSMTLEWHELNSNGTPKNCTSQETDTTTNFNARYNCGLLHLNPSLGTGLLHKLKYNTGYSVKVTEHVNLGLLGERDFVVSQFTISLPHSATAEQLAYNNTLAPPDDGGSSLAAPGPSGRNVEYYQKDHLGTIRIVSNEQGVVESTHDYEPFGLELPGQDPSDNTHRFTGHERDTETGLDYMKARYYGASMGRFGAVDIAPNGKSAPHSWNVYVYTRNNPIILYDMDGNLARADGKLVDSKGHIELNSKTGKYESRNLYTVRIEGTDKAYSVRAVTLYTDKGRPIAATSTVPLDKNDKETGKIYTTKDGGVSYQQTGYEPNLNNPAAADCHGYTVGDKMYWINNPEMNKELEDGNYNIVSDGNVTKGMLTIYRDSKGDMAHSGRIDSTDADGKAMTVDSKGGTTKPSILPIGPGAGSAWPDPATVTIYDQGQKQEPNSCLP